MKIKKRSITASRMIRDHTNSVGDVSNFKLDKSVIGHYKASRQRYHFHLDTLDQ